MFGDGADRGGSVTAQLLRRLRFVIFNVVLVCKVLIVNTKGVGMNDGSG